MFSHIKVGDTIQRNLAGVHIHSIVVTEVTDTKIIAGLGWEFCRKTGAEIDEDLGWGPAHGVTGSFLVKEG